MKCRLCNIEKDKRGIERGKCTLCPCEEFDTEGSILCEYCGHPPINHVALEDHEQTAKKLKRSNHEQVLEVGDSFGYSATSQSIDISVAQSVEIDAISTSMSINADSEMKVHEVFEIDAIPSSTPHGSDSSKQCPEDLAKIADLKDADKLPNAKLDSALQNLQNVVDDIVKTEQHQSTSVQLSVSRKKHGVFASCNVCKTEFSLRSISKGPYFLRQHLATQMHKSNSLIAHSRESDVSLEPSELHSQIKTKFPNIFILKKSSTLCRACKTNMSLLGRNVMGNLVQHVKSSGHLRNAGKGDATTSARDIASFFAPVSKKASTSAS